MPAMKDKEYKELVEDIRINKLQNWIVLYRVAGRDGCNSDTHQILDGCHRYRACLEAEVEPRFVEFLGDDPAAYVIAQNLRRRHLTASQKAMAASKLTPVIEAMRKAARKRQQSGKGADGSGGRGKKKTLASNDAKVSGREGRTAAKVAKEVGVSEASLQRATALRVVGTPEDIQAVEEGAASVGQKLAEVRKRNAPEEPLEPGVWTMFELSVQAGGHRDDVGVYVTGYGHPQEKFNKGLSAERAGEVLAPLLEEMQQECREKILAVLGKLKAVPQPDGEGVPQQDASEGAGGQEALPNGTGRGRRPSIKGRVKEWPRSG
jgi:ParB-like chromosome segregation protein Spo0J